MTALDQLRCVPAYVEVLRLEQQPRRRGGRPVSPDPSSQKEGGQRLIDTSVTDGITIEGAPASDPGLFEELREMYLDCNQVYGLANMEDLQRVFLYTANYCKLSPKAVMARGPAFLPLSRGTVQHPLSTPTHISEGRLPCL